MWLMPGTKLNWIGIGADAGQPQSPLRRKRGGSYLLYFLELFQLTNCEDPREDPRPLHVSKVPAELSYPCVTHTASHLHHSSKCPTTSSPVGCINLSRHVFRDHTFLRHASYFPLRRSLLHAHDSLAMNADHALGPIEHYPFLVELPSSIRVQKEKLAQWPSVPFPRTAWI